MSYFSNSPNWRLINDFTIYEDRNMSDRPFMLTCVPQNIDIDVDGFDIFRCVEWPSDCGEGTSSGSYTDKSYIRLSGRLRDEIIVFDMYQGEIAKFNRLNEITIRPIPVGVIGGKCNATVFDGHGFSGMSARDVPAGGLMEGEPGSLFYFGEDRKSGSDKEPALLTASLFLDEDKFFDLLNSLSSNSKGVRTFKLCLTAELFESEVSASLSEPGMKREYGMVMKGEEGTSIASTKARLDFFSISERVAALGNEVLIDDHDLSKETLESSQRSAEIAAASKSLLRYMRYTFAAILILIAVTAFGS